MQLPSLTELVAVAVAGTAAGFVNTLAGAGSLLTLPVLIQLGLPAGEANATNRVGVFMAALAGVTGFDASGKLDRRTAVKLTIPTLFGACIGSFLAMEIPEEIFKPLVLVLLGAVSITLVWKPDIVVPPEGTSPRTLAERPIAILYLVLLGAYAAFLQAGMGIFATVLLSGVLRYDLVRANALKTGMVVAITAIALSVFAAHGAVRILPGLALGVFQVIGARIAVKWADKANPKSLRYVLFVMALVCIGYTLFAG